MFSTFDMSGTRRRRAVIAGVAALVLFAGVSLQAAGSSSAAQQTDTDTAEATSGDATLELSQLDGNVLATIEGLDANSSVTIEGTVGQASGRATFATNASGGLVVALAPAAGITGQLTATATSGTTVLTDTIAVGLSGATGVSTDDATDDDAASTATGTSSGVNECLEFAGGDSTEICQGPNDGEAGEIQAYVAELIALFQDEEGMKAAGLRLDTGSSNHYRIYDTEYKRDWPSGAGVAHLVESGGKIKGAQIDTARENPEWMTLVPNSNGDSAHTHMDGKGGYWHDPH